MRLHNTPKRLIAGAMLGFTLLPIYGYMGRVVGDDGKTIEGAAVKILSGDSVVFVTATDFEGRFNTGMYGQGYELEIHTDGYENFKTTPQGYNLGDITLERTATDLMEIVVKPKDYIQEFDHKTFTLSNRQLEKYSTMWKALGELPGVDVIGGLTYRGRQGVTILLNGIRVTQEEIAALSKSDVRDIQIYDVPPSRFADGETTSVINIRTKRNITGGNTSISLSETPYHWFKSNNSAYSFYNYGKNRFTAFYRNQFYYTDNNTTDEDMRYHTLSGTIEKKRHGLPSNIRNNEHEFGAGYMYSDPDGKEATQFNANFSGTASNNRRASYSETTYSNGDSYRSHTPGRETILNLKLDLYFHRTLGEHHALFANVVGTTYGTTDKSSFHEYSDIDNKPYFEAETSYTGHNYSLIGDLAYNWFATNNGRLDAGAKYYWQRSNQDTEGTASHMIKNQASVYTGWRWNLGPVFLYGKAEGTYISTNFNSGAETESRWDFTPMLYASWSPNEKVNILATYYRYGMSPSSSDMTTQIRVKDNGLLQKGNPNLQAYSNNSFNLSQSLTTRYFDYSLNFTFLYAPGKIIPSYSRERDYVIESLTNANRANTILGSLYIKVKPFEGFSIGGNGVLGKAYLKADGESWNTPTYRFNAYVSYFNKRWEYNINYQFPGMESYGMFKRKRLQSLSFYAAYRPMPDMSIGINVDNPFMKATEETWSVINSIASTHTRSYSPSFSSSIAISFSWNFSYGRRRVEDNKSLQNNDDDSGLLKK